MGVVAELPLPLARSLDLLQDRIVGTGLFPTVA
jgi:hypothetical protein